MQLTTRFSCSNPQWRSTPKPDKSVLRKWRHVLINIFSVIIKLSIPVGIYGWGSEFFAAQDYGNHYAGILFSEQPVVHPIMISLALY